MQVPDRIAPYKTIRQNIYHDSQSDWERAE